MMKHLLSVDQLSSEDITRILDTAESFREVGTRVIKKVPALRGRTVVNLFYENSTRTRISSSSSHGPARPPSGPPTSRPPSPSMPTTSPSSSLAA